MTYPVLAATAQHGDLAAVRPVAAGCPGDRRHPAARWQRASGASRFAAQAVGTTRSAGCTGIVVVRIERLVRTKRRDKEFTEFVTDRMRVLRRLVFSGLGG